MMKRSPAFGSISRTIAELQLVGVVPKAANGGIRYGNHKFNAQLRCTWQASRFNSASATEELWQYERLMFDFSGGFDYNRNKFNHVTQAWRQPGSSFKPFIYSAALERGFTPLTVVNDALTALLIAITPEYFLFAALAPGARVGEARFVLRLAGYALEPEFA